MRVGLLIVFLLMLCSDGFSVSLWNSGSASLFTRQRAHQVGDLITIIVEERTTAVQSGSTRQQKRDDLDLSTAADIGSRRTVAGQNVNEVDSRQADLSLKGGQRYTGRGSTSRSSAIQAKITAEVVEVLPNGNLVIVGTHEVQVNEELETVMIRGVINPNDILINNVVYSSQLSQAQISVQGKGTVSSPQKPGFFSKIFGWIF